MTVPLFSPRLLRTYPYDIAATASIPLSFPPSTQGPPTDPSPFTTRPNPSIITPSAHRQPHQPYHRPTVKPTQSATKPLTPAQSESDLHTAPFTSPWTPMPIPIPQREKCTTNDHRGRTSRGVSVLVSISLTSTQTLRYMTLPPVPTSTMHTPKSPPKTTIDMQAPSLTQQPRHSVPAHPCFPDYVAVA